VSRALLALTLALAALFAPTAARAGTVPVTIRFAEFAPNIVDVLPGETVDWQNVSERTHTVTADDGLFASGELGPEVHFSQAFDQLGVHIYHCTIHPFMVGEIDVRPVTLDALPPVAVPLGLRVTFTGRTADTAHPVRVERIAGAEASAIASVAPARDGSWSAVITAASSGDYRAASSGGISETRHLFVSDRRIAVHATHRGIAVTVTPPLPYGRLVLEQDLRDRFGWWPLRRARLDYLSQASFRVTPPARVRVALVADDGWTPLTTSTVVQLGHPRASGGHPQTDGHPHHVPRLRSKSALTRASIRSPARRS